jgi:Ca2+-binding EF-hand superfamily protein
MVHHSTPVIFMLIGLGTALAGCDRTRVEPASEPAESSPPKDATVAATGAPTSGAPTVSMAHVGSCEPSAEVVGLLSRIAETADSNGNGQVEKEEARSAADFLVGGFFFRADKDADGTISPDEGRAIRAELMNRQPGFSAILKRATPDGGAALARMAELLGIEYDKPVTSTELRDAGQKLVDETFRVADSDKNGSLTQAEAQQAGWDMVHSLAKAAFSATDSNRDDKLTLEEFRAALEEPARFAFQAADLDKNGMLSETEAASAAKNRARRLWLPATPGAKTATTDAPKTN